MTFYKSTSKDSIANIVPISHSIISCILDAMSQGMRPFICLSSMNSVVNVTETLMDKNFNEWSRMISKFHSIEENISYYPANKKVDSYQNFRDLLSKSSTIPLHSMLKPWIDTLCNLDMKAFQKNLHTGLGRHFF